MFNTPNSRPVLIVAAVVFATIGHRNAQADIFRWDNDQLIPGTEGITVQPGVNLSGRNSESQNLQYANLSGNMRNARFDASWLQSALLRTADLSGANFAGADLTDATFSSTTLTGANFAGATVTQTSFENLTRIGFEAEQLYSTASYQAKNLYGIGLSVDDLSGWDLSGQNLNDAVFTNATLTGTQLNGATIAGALFSRNTSRGLTSQQFYATASYQLHNLERIRFRYEGLSGWDFSGQDLTNAEFTECTLVGTSFAGAIVEGATFATTSGLTKEQFYATASYQQRNLQGISLYELDLTGWDLSGFDLTDARFDYSNLDGADLTGAIVTRASFATIANGGITKEQLYSTVNYAQKKLQGVGFYRNDLRGTDFRGQNLTEAQLAESQLAGADFSGAIITGTSFSETTQLGFTKEQLYSTANYQQRDLRHVGLGRNDLSGWDFSGQDLTRAYLAESNLTGADFTGANVTRAIFERAIGFTPEQLYSTASYQQKDLRSFSVSHVDVSGWDFSEQNLQNADFDDAIYIGTNLTAADTRGGQFFEFSTALSRNTIAPDGTLTDLALADGDRLVIRDYDGDAHENDPYTIPPIPISARGSAKIATGGTLQLAFEADDWNSTITFESGIPVTLGGVLELTFTADTNVAGQIGRTFLVFNWNGVAPTGEFDVESPYVWDTSKLYTTGEITLAAVPEPAGMALLVVAILFAIALRRRAAPALPRSPGE